MKKVNTFTILFSVVVFLFSCGGTSNEIIRETPSSVNPGGINSIYVGWLDLKESDAKIYGFEGDNWKTEIKRNNTEGLQIYLKDALPGKKISGAKSIADQYPGNADLQLQFKVLDKIKYDLRGGFSPICELKVDVIFIDGKSGKLLYTATMLTTCTFSFSNRNWKANSFDGALDNEIFKLANAIAGKLKS